MTEQIDFLSTRQDPKNRRPLTGNRFFLCLRRSGGAELKKPRPLKAAGAADLSELTLVGVDFVADDAADCGTTHGTYGAATGQYGTADGADAGTYGGIGVPLRHAGTSRQTEQHSCDQGATCNIV
jgi:hypothetical protein